MNLRKMTIRDLGDLREYIADEIQRIKEYQSRIRPAALRERANMITEGQRMALETVLEMIR